MPKSKPPRRRYRPLRRIDSLEARMMQFYDKLEVITDKLQQKASPFLDQIPARERACFLAQVAETRTDIARSRADVLKPSPTPVLDALIREDAALRRAQTRLRP